MCSATPSAPSQRWTLLAPRLAAPSALLGRLDLAVDPVQRRPPRMSSPSPGPAAWPVKGKAFSLNPTCFAFRRCESSTLCLVPGFVSAQRGASTRQVHQLMRRQGVNVGALVPAVRSKVIAQLAHGTSKAVHDSGTSWLAGVACACWHELPCQYCSPRPTACIADVTELHVQLRLVAVGQLNDTHCVTAGVSKRTAAACRMRTAAVRSQRRALLVQPTTWGRA